MSLFHTRQQATEVCTRYNAGQPSRLETDTSMARIHNLLLHPVLAGALVFSLSVAANVQAAPPAATVAEQAAQRPAHWAQPVDPANNLYRITPTLYRSAKLNEAMLPELQRLGIRTVINLRAQNNDEKVLRNSGIHRIDIPMRAWNIDDDKVAAALQAIKEAEKRGPVLFHCQHGADRTGVVAAMYRIIFQRWSREAALAELQDGGYGFHSIWVNIPRYVLHVDISEIQKKLIEYK